ncbi:spore-associated protein A [Streptomyces sp. NBC_00853]|uniref:spore-associated protein A n=1 Tax=Streptomyces sp. NBC_00853 TaxID=2903681 RepID=UPI0038734AB7|nr:spore-associated protein A [Streptomyces sp. NBC_00853]
MKLAQKIKEAAASKATVRLSSFAVSAALAACCLIAFPSNANAAERGAYNGACGAGYSVVNQQTVFSEGGLPAAKVYLTYSKATGKNCAVTVNAWDDSAWLFGVNLERSDNPDSYQSDYGTYRVYAGPVYVNAKGTCVNWGGQWRYQTAYRSNTNCG